MEKLFTNNQQQFSHKANRLESLQEISKRNGLVSDKEWQDELYRLEKGQEGEHILLNYLEEFGRSHWKIVTNIWLDYYGIFECDLLLLTRAGTFPFEVKNYSGKFVLENNQCSISGKTMNTNPITQTQRVSTNLKDIFAGLAQVNCHPATLSFVGVDNKVEIRDQVNNIKIISRAELAEHIRSLAAFERNHYGNQLYDQQILTKLNEIEKENPYETKELPSDILDGITPGIRCSRCANFNIKITKNYISCTCGQHESREEAILRTIHEYAIIYRKDSYTSSEILNFFNNQIPYRTLLRALSKNYQKNGSNRYTKYIIPSVSFEKNRENFNIKQPRFLVF